MQTNADGRLLGRAREKWRQAEPDPIWQHLTCRDEGCLADIAKVLGVMSLVAHFRIQEPSNPGLHIVNICQAQLIQLLGQVDVGLIWLVIIHIPKLAIR